MNFPMSKEQAQEISTYLNAIAQKIFGMKAPYSLTFQGPDLEFYSLSNLDAEDHMSFLASAALALRDATEIARHRETDA